MNTKKIKYQIESLQRQHQSDLQSLNKEIAVIDEKIHDIKTTLGKQGNDEVNLNTVALQQIIESFHRQFDFDLQMVNHEITRLQEAISNYHLPTDPNNDVVKLNVGGLKYQTTRETLKKIPNSYFDDMLSAKIKIETYSHKPNTFFIDRDGTHFQYILDILRDDGRVDIPQELEKKVRKELLFYRLPIYKRIDVGSIEKESSPKLEDPKQIQQPKLEEPTVIIEPPKSKIIDTDSFKILNDWIDNTKQLDFELLYRGSENEFKASAFHNKCDGKGATITIVQSSDGNIFGGYNSQSWNGKNVYYGDNKCFLFTLVNKHNIKPTKYLPNPKTSYFVSSHPLRASTFGSGYDLCIKESKSYQYFPHSYVDSTGYGNTTLTPEPTFSLKDYEVYLIKS
ncbi:hypothetical protein CYY_005879 [Polysphondylium violaceum]|uniref:TLDc domain-containing protein n=1 Tax=Polysphondylium violaceum TaxID=133409 RepID=A0A8J4PS10_9MYCE|nr:hypothetical protein CYY_005879 [Polysphondylium violaceum]